MTELSPEQIVQLLAEKIPLRDTAVQIIEEMETAFKAEAAEAYTREKRLKEEVESLKAQLRLIVGATGEKAAGVTLAHTQQVKWDVEHEQEVVDWCCIHAPTLLTLKGVTEIRKWFFSSPIQTVSINGKPSSILVTAQVVDTETREYAVPCPFFLADETQVRISETALVTEVDRQKWESEHE